MSSEIAIQVDGLSKCYHIYDKPRDRLLQMFSRGRKQYFREFWALRDVSFEVRKGETVGILGRNGSGKSTLLQLICGTLNPTSGAIRTNGRIAALLELGAGFNPEFTGRENVALSCALLGMSPDEAAASFDDIAAFADIGDFIEQPVKTYSSGMYVRLAFAVNIVAKPDIMIVDEALAVGDMNFQAKCMSAMTRLQQSGATVLFVSHDTSAVKSLCSRAVYLERGQVRTTGPAGEVAELYMRTMREEMNAEQQGSAASVEIAEARRQAEEGGGGDRQVPAFVRSEEFEARVAALRYGTGGARITHAELVDLDGNALSEVEFDQEVRVVVHFESEVEEAISCNYYVADAKKNYVIGSSMNLPGFGLLQTRRGGRYVAVYSTRMPLCEGHYALQLELTKPLIPDQSAEFLDVIDNAVVFRMARRPNGRIWAQAYVPNALEVRES